MPDPGGDVGCLSLPSTLKRLSGEGTDALVHGSLRGVLGWWCGEGRGLASMSCLIWWVHLPWLIRVMLGSGYLDQ